MQRRGGETVRVLGRLLLLFVLAVVVGRLMLERTGTGRTVLFVLLPAMAVLAVVVYGWRAGILGLVLLLALAFLARWAFTASPQAWILFLLAPVAAATAAILVSVLRRMAADRRANRGEGG